MGPGFESQRSHKAPLAQLVQSISFTPRGSEVRILQGAQSNFFSYICNMKDLILESVTNNLVDFQIDAGSEQRTVGDLIEYQIKQIILGLKDSNLVKECLEPRSKKSIEDVTLVGVDNVTNYIDTKTHDIESEFSMPNLTSVEKIRKLLLDSSKSLIYVFVSYKKEDNMVVIKKIEVKYIWEIDFSILRIGSLGKGQLQISNMNKELVFTQEGKTSWLENLKSKVREYHQDRINQIEKDKLSWL